MKTFTCILLAVTLIAARSAKVVKAEVPRRLFEPVTMAAGAAILLVLASKSDIKLDANELVDQLKGVFASQAQNGAVVINMAKDKKGHNMFMMPDVFNFEHTVYHENYCAHGHACHAFKTSGTFSSTKVKICMDSPWGIPKRTHIVSEGGLYVYNGDGLDMIGSVDKWAEGLKNGRRLDTRIFTKNTPFSRRLLNKTYAEMGHPEDLFERRLQGPGYGIKPPAAEAATTGALAPTTGSEVNVPIVATTAAPTTLSAGAEILKS